MIGRIIEYCAKNPFLVITGILLSLFGAIYSIKNIPLDAIPDLSDTQVIIFTEWMGRSPDLIEDQITYPLVSRFLSMPKVVSVRGFSMFGMSFVYIIFEDNTDIYWARSRIVEYMASINNLLPEDAKPVIGPDATSLGWIFQYALVDKSGKNRIEDITTIQEFYLKNALLSVSGVSEVATIGGFLKQYQVKIKPSALYAYGLSVMDIANAIKMSNRDIGARIIEISSREYYIRGQGYIKSLADIEKIVIKNSNPASIIKVGDIASVSIVPDIRRGAADLNGEGEVVSGIVIMRYGENALNVIKRVKNKLEEIKGSLPDGLEVKVVYDRSSLIERAIETLKKTLIEEIIVVSLIIIIFLLHFRSSLVPIITLPIGVMLSFIPMYLLKIDSNIMSLGGIAIAIGAMVDASIVLVENVHKRFERSKDIDERKSIIIDSLKEVGPSIFYSLLIITISFLPVFTLTGQSGKLFKPLAYTKTFAMFFAAMLSITLVPAIMRFVIKGKIIDESEHPISRLLIKIYRPFLYVALKNPITTILIGLLAIISAIPLIFHLGSEFMPPLYEGDLLYMPTTFPNISIEEAKRVLRIQDSIIKKFPEVECVLGKIGRASTPTDPAPLSMAENIIKLKPQSEWRDIEIKRWYSNRAPMWLRSILNYLLPEKRKLTPSELIAELDSEIRIPGFTNAWTMPIKARIDMLSTGIRTPVGIKIFGKDISEIESVGEEIEKTLKNINGVRMVFSERNTGGLYVDIVPDREKIGHYGLKIEDILSYIETAIGAMEITTTVERKERYTINIRFSDDVRNDIDFLKNIPVPIYLGTYKNNNVKDSNNSKSSIMRMSNSSMMDEMRANNTDYFYVASEKEMNNESDKISNYEGAYIRLSDVADIKINQGPSMIKNENGMLAGYVYVDIDESITDIGSFVEMAKKEVKNNVNLPTNTYLKWTGQYELMETMYRNMKLIIPLTLALIFVLLYLNFKSIVDVLIVLIVLPFSLVGCIWALSIFGYNISVATIVGIIALLGLAAETGIVMLLYLNLIFQERLSQGRINTREDLLNTVLDGAVLRVRPKMMTVLTTFIGLVPLMWATGSGADVMRRMALPMIGGLITSLFLTLEIIPVIFMYTRLKILPRDRTGN